VLHTDKVQLQDTADRLLAGSAPRVSASASMLVIVCQQFAIVYPTQAPPDIINLTAASLIDCTTHTATCTAGRYCMHASRTNCPLLLAQPVTLVTCTECRVEGGISLLAGL
jgi:hypothetical protein